MNTETIFTTKVIDAPSTSGNEGNEYVPRGNRYIVTYLLESFKTRQVGEKIPGESRAAREDISVKNNPEISTGSPCYRILVNRRASTRARRLANGAL